MAEAQSEFGLLIERVRAGSPEAAAELVKRYGPLVQKAVRRKLNGRMRAKYDSLDFMQSVWAAFFTRDVHRAEFAEPKYLVNFLCRLARSKVIDAFRQRLQTVKHDIDAEHSLDSACVVSRPWCLAAADPTASQLAVAQEQWNRIVADQPPLYRAVLALLRRGWTHEQIAEKLDISTKTISRLVHRVQARLET
jgi:RNA polymerase sigma factor (sigma-70 family)